tara:strand:+ start:61 stop:444 length:384 start_codon:yes stop_codon:yes gene_type:complete
MKKLLFILMFLPFIGFGQNKCNYGDCKNGYGEMTSSEGTYKGNWKDGKVNGFGLFKGSSLDYDYTGEYLNGKKHGQGKKTYKSGKVEKGLWYYDVFQEPVKPNKITTTWKPPVKSVCNRKSKITIAN